MRIRSAVWPAPMSILARLSGVRPQGGVLIQELVPGAEPLGREAGVTRSIEAVTDADKRLQIAIFESTDALDDFLATEAGQALRRRRGSGVWACAVVDRLRHEVPDDEAFGGTPPTLLWMKDMKSTLSPRDLAKTSNGRKPTFRTLEGLRQKFYLFEAHRGTNQGLYLWDSRELAEAYLEGDFARAIPEAYALERGPEPVFLRLS